MAEPMYRQIAEDLRQKIESGDLAPGTQLPTEFELREAYSASRNTIRDALKLLTTRGLVQTHAGQGTFVTKLIVPFVTTLTGDPGSGDSVVYDAAVRAELRNPEFSAPRVEVQAAEGQIAQALDVPEGTQVISRHQRCFIDETPWALMTSFYPMSLALRGAARLLAATNIDEGAVAYLAAEFGIKQVGYRDQIKVRPPDEDETAFFKLPQDGQVSVFAVLRTAFDQEQKPARVTITVYPVDRNQFAINVGEVPPATKSAG